MRKWINELVDGDRVILPVLIAEVHKGVTSKQTPYLSFIIQDKTGQMDAKYWSIPQEHLSLYKAGMFVAMKGDVLQHKKQLQFRVLEMKVLDQQDINFSDFVSSSIYSTAQLQEKIQSAVEQIENDAICKIVNEIITMYQDRLYTYPAASKNHHNFIGGLATHIIGMLELTHAICSCYPDLNKDYLIAGVILHDIGKVIELSGPIATEYTMEGKLLGHISIMQATIASVAKQLQLDGEEAILLRHMVLSHHGVYEYGSPVLPMIPEAEVLYLIDNLDARMNTIQKLLQNVEPGEFSTRCFALENRAFYQKKRK